MLASAARETGPALGHTPAEASLRRPARRLRRARTRTTEARPKRPFRSRRRCRVVKISGGSPNALRSEVGPGTGTWSSRSSGSPRLPALSATFYCRRSLVMGRTAYLLAAEGLLCPRRDRPDPCLDPGVCPERSLRGGGRARAPTAQSELGSRGGARVLSPDGRTNPASFPRLVIRLSYGLVD
jgi:hypothetical protein